MKPRPLCVGTQVSKIGGDYRFDGVVVAVFTKLSGVTRYVVEDDRGVLHIYSERNLALRATAASEMRDGTDKDGKGSAACADGDEA